MTVIATIAGAYPKIGDKPEEQKLRRALHQFDQGEMEQEDLDKVTSEVTQEAIREQTDAGMGLVTDGLIRWSDALTYQARRIRGIRISGLIRYFDTNTFYREPIIETRLEALPPILASDYQFAAGVSSRPVRAILTGPFTLAKLSRNTFYRDFKQLSYDFAHTVHGEAKALEEAGCRYLQFDEPALLHYKEELSHFFRLYEVVCAELGKAEKTILFNFGSVEQIYPKILQLPVERLGLELVPGHRNWEVLKGTKFSKKLMAGVIDARNTKMEREEELVEALRTLSEVTNLDDVWIAPSHSLEFLPRAVARKKMELAARVATQLKGASAT